MDPLPPLHRHGPALGHGLPHDREQPAGPGVPGQLLRGLRCRAYARGRRSDGELQRLRAGHLRRHAEDARMGQRDLRDASGHHPLLRRRGRHRQAHDLPGRHGPRTHPPRAPVRPGLPHRGMDDRQLRHSRRSRGQSLPRRHGRDEPHLPGQHRRRERRLGKPLLPGGRALRRLLVQRALRHRIRGRDLRRALGRHPHEEVHGHGARRHRLRYPHVLLAQPRGQSPQPEIGHREGRRGAPLAGDRGRLRHRAVQQVEVRRHYPARHDRLGRSGLPQDDRRP